jgi:hypothetical protein
LRTSKSEGQDECGIDARDELGPQPVHASDFGKRCAMSLHRITRNDHIDLSQIVIVGVVLIILKIMPA